MTEDTTKVMSSGYS